MFGSLSGLLLVLLVHNLRTAPTFAYAIMKNGSNIGIADDGLQGRLVFAHVIYRHGDRIPLKSYPTDPWNNIVHWPTGWGQLTNIGKQQQYLLGQWLRQRYDNLLGSNYSYEKIYIRSTDYDRTIMSALSNLAGLYPPAPKEKWNEEINWQPIPVHTVPKKLDNVLAAHAPCPAYGMEYSSVMETRELKELNSRYTNLYRYLAKHTGIDGSGPDFVLKINNTLYVESLYNKTLPEWTKKVYPSADMNYLSELAHALLTYTPKMARLRTGPLIKEILERFTLKAKGELKPDRNVWIYSAHDSTVVSVLRTLKVKDIFNPDYAACIMFELRIDDEQQPFVSVFYKNSLASELELLSLPGCEPACPLYKMFMLYENILPIDWDAECSESTSAMGIKNSNTSEDQSEVAALNINYDDIDDIGVHRRKSHSK